MNVVSKILNGVVDFALPPVCVGCGKPINYHKDFVCLECLKTLNDISNTVYQAPNVDYFFSVYKFDEENPIQKIIHSLKYEQMKSIGIKFGKILGEKIKERINVTFDYIVPVPLHRAKERERKFNQSTFLCRGANSVLNIELGEKCLMRLRYTESQTKLSVDERKENVKDAFVVRKQYTENILGKNIILVDDVVTTGSTILECASVLKSAGYDKVLACTLAKA
jgi:ComF family protein